MNKFFKNLFSRKESQSSRSIFITTNGGRSIRSTDSYDKLCDEGYGQNAVVYACIREIAQAVSSVPLILRQRRGDMLDEIESHPLLDLLKHPNPLQSDQEFMEAVVSYLMISGNTFIESAGARSGRGVPKELYTLRPDRVEILPDPVHLIKGYQYKVGQTKITYDLQQVRHLKLFNPGHDFMGLSPIAVAALNIDKMNQGDKWNASLMGNAAVPSGTLNTKRTLTDPQFDRLKANIKEFMQGIKNAREPVLLDNELEWNGMGLSPVDMDFLKGINASASFIATVFNMPHELIGLAEATYQNRNEARKTLYSETALPILKKVVAALNHWLVPRFGENLMLDIDTDKIEALSEDQDSLYKRANESTFLTINEKRRMTGYDDVPGADFISLNANQIALEDFVGGDQELDETDLGIDEDDEDEKCCHNLPHDKGGLRGVDESDLPQDKSFQIENGKAFTKKERSIFRKQFLAIARQRRTLDRKYKKQIKSLLDSESSAVAKAHKSDPVNGAIQAIENNEAKWLDLIKQIHFNSFKQFGSLSLDSVKSQFDDFEIKEDVERVTSLLDELALRFAKNKAGEAVTNVSNTSKKRIRNIISNAIGEGLGIGEVAQSLRDGLKEVNPFRAHMIARTEIHKAQNLGQLESIKALGRNDMEKGWMWSGKSRTGHSDVDGTWVSLLSDFIVGGKNMYGPGDSRGGAVNVILCACALMFRRAN
jgi:HK97 family phage portal protein